MIRDYILWGGTGQARVLIELLHRRPFRLAAVIDRSADVSPATDVPLLRDAMALDAWLFARDKEPPAALVAIGGNHGAERRRLLAYLAQRGCEMLTVVHDSAYVAVDAQIGLGSQILAGSVVSARARLGEAVIVNTGATIDHDCLIAAGSHIGPGATLTGEITVERDVFVGAGATILPRLHIGEGAVIGAGAVVIRDVPAGTTVIGVPAAPRSAGPAA